MKKVSVVDRWESHPLSGVILKRTLTWRRWLAKWAAATDKQNPGDEGDVLNLLHRGFNVEADTEEKGHRLCLYLRLADGRHHRSADLVICQKAWKTLVMEEFRISDLTFQFATSWYWLLKPEPFDHLVEFFLRPGNMPPPRENGREIEDRNARQFIEMFAWAAAQELDNLSLFIDSPERRQNLFRLLMRLQKLDVLLGKPLLLQRDDLKFLIRQGRDDNRFKTLDECFAAGSGGASYVAGVVIQILAKRRGKQIRELVEGAAGPETGQRITTLRSQTTFAKV